MINRRILFLDESGKASFNDRSKSFILAGCSIPAEKVEEIKKTFEMIIFKYWGSQNSYSRKYGVNKIVFHTINIVKCDGPFRILKDPKINKGFWDDLLSQIIFKTYITYYLSIVDKLTIKTKVSTWTEETTLRRSYDLVIDAYIKHLIASRSIGEVSAESSFDQDLMLIKTFHSFKRLSYKKYSSSTLVDKKITSLSVINKHDDDIGSQIADLIAWTGKHKYLIDNNLSIQTLSYGHRKMLKMFNKRLNSHSNLYKFNKFFVITR